MEYIYELAFKVRDYECDLQGIVNNAVYQNYLEHTRHEFMLQENISFDEMHKKGNDAVVIRAEINFKNALKSRDEFVSKLYIKKDSLKYIFYQDIYRLPDNKICIKSQFDVVCIKNGMLSFSEELNAIFAKYPPK